MKKLAVFTSGGDSPGMNACIRAVVRSCMYHGVACVGIMRGYEGMIDGDFMEMESRSVSNIIQRGGTILKTARSKRFLTPEGRKQAFENLQRAGISGAVAIGGNGTFTGALEFHSEFGFPMVGVPGTIDNDLFGTDFTLGFDTAVNTALEAIDRIRDTADSHNRLFFVEVMGRDAGFIALYSGIAGGAESVLIPETVTDLPALISLLERGWQRKKSSAIIVVAEGDEEGGAFRIAEEVKAKFNQYDTRVSILGHLQRGGSPTYADRVLGSRLGVAAVEALLEGRSSLMAGQRHHDIVFTPFAEAIRNKGTLDTRLVHLVDMLSV